MSRVFKARTSHSDGNPQLCGLTGTPIQEGDYCFYLVCNGKQARPEYQISVVREESKKGTKYKKKIRETPDGTPFFSVCTGEWETFKKANGKTGRRKVFEWQTEDPVTGARIPVKVWSNMVLASAAEKLGYRVPKTAKGKYITTTAHQGERTRGYEHRLADEAEPAMVTVAKAALSDEEAGLVAPGSEPEKVEEAAVEAESQQAPESDDSEEAELAAALGMTLDQYRKALAE